MTQFKNKQGTMLVETTKTDGLYNVYVYDYILLRDVFKSSGLSKSKAEKLLNELKIKHECFIEVI